MSVEIFSAAVEPLFFLTNPEKRVYWLYLLSGLAIAVAVKGHNATSVRRLVQWRAWLSHSTVIDLQWLFSNHILRTALVIPLLGGQIALAMEVHLTMHRWFGAGDFIALGPLVTTAVFSITLFLAEDLSRFLLHYANHHVPLLWRFHAVHHGATTLTPLTLYRIHSVEMCLASCRSLMVTGGVSGVFIYLFSGPIGPAEIMGASVFNMLFNIAGANLRHSHVWVSFGRVEKWFVSPAQHQMHHSAAIEHRDINLGATLAIWDRLLGCWSLSKGEHVTQYGIGAKEAPFTQQLLGHPYARTRNRNN